MRTELRKKWNPQSKGSVFPGTVSEEGDRGQKRRDSRRKYFFVPSVAGMLIAGEVVRDILTENGKGLNKNRKIEERTCERRNETEIYRNSRKQQSAF